MIENLRKITETSLRGKLEAAKSALQKNGADQDALESSIRDLDQEVKKKPEGSGCGATALGCGGGCLVSLLVVLVIGFIASGIPLLKNTWFDPHSEANLYLWFLLSFIFWLLIKGFYGRKENEKKESLLKKITENQESISKSERLRPALEQTALKATQELEEFLHQSEAWQTIDRTAQTEPINELGAFTVMLMDAGTNKIDTIKVVREVTSLDLKEAKALVDSAPTVLKKSISEERARTIKRRFKGVATVKIQEGAY